MCSVHRSTATSGMAVFSDGKSSKIGGPVIHIFGHVKRWKITVNRPEIQTIGPNIYKNNTSKVQTGFPVKAPVFISDMITLGSTIRPSTRKLKIIPSKPINHVALSEADFAKEHCTMINFSFVQRKYIGWRRSNKRLE